MTTLTAATLAFVKSLREAGADEKLTEAITTGVPRIVEASGSELATKADLVAGLAELRTEIAALEVRLTNRLYGMAALILLAFLIQPYLPLP